MQQYSNINIFDDEPRLKSGINRFKNLFILSPMPLYKKVLVILNYQVIYSIIWLFMKKMKTEAIN